MSDRTGTKRVGAGKIRELLVAELATILQVREDEISTSKTFDEYGLDSMDAVIVVGIVEERIDMELEPELLLRNRSIDEVIHALKELKIVDET